MKFETEATIIVVIGVVAQLALVIVGVAVAIHFITKFW